MLDQETKDILKSGASGMYIRKRTSDGKYDATNGWQRKWTYKVSWRGYGEKIHLVAMTDGLVTNERTKGSFSQFIDEEDMVFMTKYEFSLFVLHTDDTIFRAEDYHE